MSTITAILESDADGNLRLPLPPELRHGKVKVQATVEPAPEASEDPPRRARAGLWKDLPGPFWMAEDFDEPLEEFREYME